MSSSLDPKSVVWLASYPRSGNTFIRLLLANYFLARFEAISLHTLKEFNFGEHIEWLWQNVTGKPATERDEKVEWRARDSYFEKLRITTPSVALRFIKTHTVNCTRWGAPAFRFRPTDRIIYVARSPLDVAVSLAAFHGWDEEQAIAHMLAPFATLAGHPLTGYEVTGSWNLHVTSWVQATGAPVLVIPYYQLVGDPAAWLTRILTFIGIPVGEQQVKNAALWSQFASLQKQEAHTGFPEAPRGENRQPFFRVGKPGQWKDQLSRAQVDRILNACTAGMNMVGFPPITLPENPVKQAS